MAFYWQANDGPHLVAFGSLIPFIKTTKINSVRVGPLLLKLSGSAHGGLYGPYFFYFN